MCTMLLCVVSVFWKFVEVINHIYHLNNRLVLCYSITEGSFSVFAMQYIKVASSRVMRTDANASQERTLNNSF